MQKYRVKVVFPALLLAAILMGGFGPAGALAQCGSNYGSMHDQHMGNSGHMDSGHMGAYGNQVPVQPDPNAGYVAPVQPPVSGYTTPQDSGSYGQMMGRGGAASGSGGHMGH